MSKAAIISFFNTIIPISKGLEDRLFQTLQEKELKAGDFLISEGEVSDRVHFIVKGLFKSYYINQSGKEAINWFMREGDVVISVYSYYSQLPAYESVLAIEDSKVLFVDRTVIDEMYRDFSEFNFIGRLLTERYYLQSELRLHSMRKCNAAQRYELFENTHKNLLNRISVEDVAAYLGLSARSVFRARKKLLGK